VSSYEKPDYWSLKAQKEGYPARSVYKLKEIDERFGLIKSLLKHSQPAKPRKVLDIGAAPGSWSLYVLRAIGSNGMVVGVDLAPVSREFDRGLFDTDNFVFVQGDITDDTVQKQVLAQGPYDLVLSDVAPATTGNRLLDTLRSFELAEKVLGYAEHGLTTGGNLVVKVFQGKETPQILIRIRSLFKIGRSFKPEACRSESFETYYLGLEKL
jgi:23S rRNA (uridine2552-2'-O)-methyltransferase